MIAYDILGCGIGGFFLVSFLFFTSCGSDMRFQCFGVCILGLGLVQDGSSWIGCWTMMMMIHVVLPGDIHVCFPPGGARISTCVPYLCSCMCCMYEYAVNS